MTVLDSVYVNRFAYFSSCRFQRHRAQAFPSHLCECSHHVSTRKRRVELLLERLLVELLVDAPELAVDVVLDLLLERLVAELRLLDLLLVPLKNVIITESVIH